MTDAPAATAPAASQGTLLGSATLTPTGAPEGSSAPPNGSVAPPALGTPWWSDFIRTDGTLNHAALERLPEDLRPFKDNLTRYKNPDDIIRSFKHAETLVGKKGLMPLDENAPAEAKAEFDKRLREVLRVPEKPEGYGIKKPDGIPDEQWDGEFANAVTQAMHKHAIPPGAAQDLFKLYQENRAKEAQVAEQQASQWREEQAKALRTEWKADFETKLANARRAAYTAGIDEETLNSHPAFNDATIIKAFARLFDMGRESSFVKGTGPKDAANNFRGQIDDILSNAANPLHSAYLDPAHPRYMEAVREVERLTELEVRSRKR